MAAFVRDAVTPLVGAGRESLSEVDWRALQGKLAAYDAWMAARPATSVGKLGHERLRAIVGGEAGETLCALLVVRDAGRSGCGAALAKSQKLRIQRASAAVEGDDEPGAGGAPTAWSVGRDPLRDRGLDPWGPRVSFNVVQARRNCPGST